MYGPPGCGKTFLAGHRRRSRRPLHGGGHRRRARYVVRAVGKKLHGLFVTARQQALDSVFDEVDALGGRRSASRHDHYCMLVAQFRADMDGIGSTEKDAVLVMGATNAPGTSIPPSVVRALRGCALRPAPDPQRHASRS